MSSTNHIVHISHASPSMPSNAKALRGRCSVVSVFRGKSNDIFDAYRVDKCMPLHKSCTGGLLRGVYCCAQQSFRCRLCEWALGSARTSPNYTPCEATLRLPIALARPHSDGSCIAFQSTRYIPLFSMTSQNGAVLVHVDRRVCPSKWRHCALGVAIKMLTVSTAVADSETFLQETVWHPVGDWHCVPVVLPTLVTCVSTWPHKKSK